MAEVIWAEPALSDLDAIADYIALDNPEAARRVVQRIFEHVDHLEDHPKLGSKPKELRGCIIARLLSRRVVSFIVKSLAKS